MKTGHHPDAGVVLTVETADSAAAARLADWVRQAWALEPVELSRPGDPRTWVEIYFCDGVAAGLARRVLAARPEARGVAARDYRERDWRAYWRRHFQPLAVGRRLLIRPAWRRARAADRGRATVIIDPGLSFGTGDHFTTRFCLEALDRIFPRAAPRRVLDAGAGSGILALAAARLGCRTVVAFDSDEQALRQARINIRLNRLERRIRLLAGDVTRSLPSGRFDVVCANLYARLLVDAAPALAAAAARYLVLSGMREPEADEVADAFLALGARETARDGDGDWCGLVLERP